MANRSALGWDTIVEYEDDPMASDSYDWKKIRQAENRAVAKRKTKTFKRLTLRVLSQKPSGQQFRIDGDHNGFTPPNQRNFNLRFPSNNFTQDGYFSPDTETKVEGMKIDNEFSDLSNDYTIQESEFEKGK